MSLKLFACGDVVNFSSSDFIDQTLKSIIQSCDVAICNLEGPIQHEKKKVGIIPRNAPLFYKLVSILKMLLKDKDKKREKEYLLLLHNIRIDSHRFLVQRALSLLTQEEIGCF